MLMFAKVTLQGSIGVRSVKLVLDFMGKRYSMLSVVSMWRLGHVNLVTCFKRGDCFLI